MSGEDFNSPEASARRLAERDAREKRWAKFYLSDGAVKMRPAPITAQDVLAKRLYPNG